jgi:c-di-GMP-binding flagellar brake protein YcgR
MRNILASFILLITFSCVVFLLWRQRTRNLAYVSAKADGCWDNVREKRKFRRFKKELPVDCSIEERPDNTYKTFTKDISGEGICLVVPEIMPKESILSLAVAIPDAGTIKITGRVVWVKEREKGINDAARSFKAGIKFLKISERDRKLLDNFLIEAAR